MNMRTWFPISSGLLSRDHHRRIGPSIWVFLWFIHHQYRPKDGEPDTGGVNGGHQISYEQIGADLGIPTSTCEKHVRGLEREQYIRSESIRGLGKRYFVANPIRWTLWGTTKNGDTTEVPRAGVPPKTEVGATKNGKGVPPKTEAGATKFGDPNKEQRTQDTQDSKTTFWVASSKQPPTQEEIFSESVEEIKPKPLPKEKLKPDTRGTRIPDNFAVTEEHRALARNLGVDADHEFPKFHDHWVAQPGQRGRKLDWERHLSELVTNGNPDERHARAKGKDRTRGRSRHERLHGGLQAVARRKL
jgi:hypothetical protein